MSRVIVVAADSAFEQRVRAALNGRGGDGVLRWDRPLADSADVKALAWEKTPCEESWASTATSLLACSRTRSSPLESARSESRPTS